MLIFIPQELETGRCQFVKPKVNPLIADYIVLKELPPIVEGQAFGLHEMIANSKIICDTETAHLLTVNSTDLFTILNEKEIFSILDYESWIKFPEDVEIVKEALADLKDKKMQKKIVDDYNKTIKQQKLIKKLR